MVRTLVGITGDIHQIVQGGRLYSLEGPAFMRRELAMADSLQLRWPCPRSPCGYYVALTDNHGNEVLWAGSPTAPLYANEPAVAVSAPLTERGAWYARPGPLLAGAALVLAVVGGYFGFQFQRAQQALIDVNNNRAAHQLSDAYSLDGQRRSDQIVMFGMFGGAVAAGGAGVILW